jgi:hypothetical protein
LGITVERGGLREIGFMLAPVWEWSKEGAIALDKRVMVEQGGYRGLITEVGGRYYSMHFLYFREFSVERQCFWLRLLLE